MTRLLLDKRPRQRVVPVSHDPAEVTPTVSSVSAPDAAPLDAY